MPEISLAPQTVGRVRARFGDRVAMLHSGLTDAERRDERERIASGEARIVVGARSAVFAPVHGLGLIVVDEEHDASYKQDSDPRYDARTIAAKRAALEGAVAVYGSATPRPESWAALERLELGGRVTGGLPPVRVVDLRREAGYPLSAPLLSELRRIADGGGKAILLLNRRGVAPALHCRACGSTIRCPNCDVALVLHGDARPALPPLRPCASRRPATCPACGSAELARLGAGTQRLERELERELPGAGADPARRRHDREARADDGARCGGSPTTDRAVLLGTQMVAKGHHFAGVALAAVVDADTALALPDFRAEERTFQLITQLAGRSGRDAPGRVLVQTFQPDARPIAYAARHDVRRFLAEELERRRDLGYPPFSHLVRIVVAGPELAPVLQALEELRDGMRDVELLGPAPLLRLRGRHRAQLIAKTDRPRAVARRPRGCWPPRRRRCGVPGSRSSSTSTRNRSDPRRARRTPPEGARRGHNDLVIRPHAEEILGEWGIRDVTPPSQRERKLLESEPDLNPLFGRRCGAGSATSAPRPTTTSPPSAARCPTCAGCGRSRTRPIATSSCWRGLREHGGDPAAWRRVAEAGTSAPQRADRQRTTAGTRSRPGWRWIRVPGTSSRSAGGLPSRAARRRVDARALSVDFPGRGRRGHARTSTTTAITRMITTTRR